MYRLNPRIKRCNLFNGHEAALERQPLVLDAGDGKTISFTVADFIRRPLHGLEERLSPDDFSMLLNTLGFRKGEGIIAQHFNAQKLEVYYFPVPGNPRDLVLLAFGEISPGHFMLDLEGMLEWQD